MNDSNMIGSRRDDVAMAQDRTVPEHHGLGVVDDVVGDLPRKLPVVASAPVPVSAQKPRATPDTFGTAVGPLDDVRIGILPRNPLARVMNVQDAVTSVMIGRMWIAP